MRRSSPRRCWRAVTGQIDVVSAWDDYIERLMNAGLDRLPDSVGGAGPKASPGGDAFGALRVCQQRCQGWSGAWWRRSSMATWARCTLLACSGPFRRRYLPAMRDSNPRPLAPENDGL